VGSVLISSMMTTVASPRRMRTVATFASLISLSSRPMLNR
jgi:hypothetical protein